MALSFKMKREKRIAAAFMGDGATNEGIFHEALNMSAIWDLPVLWVVENNLYGASTPVSMVMKVPHISDRACAYGMPGETVDGNDVIAVYEATREAGDRARAGKGPTLLELVTYRITGHSRRDPALYQPDGTADQTTLDGLREEAKAEVERSVQRALAAPLPKPEDALEDMFV
jgi:pyruvate dehydrogenase E1 component alpha subunit